MPDWLRLRGIGFANCIPLRLRCAYSRPGDIERSSALPYSKRGYHRR